MDWEEAQAGLAAAHREGRALSYVIELWRRAPHHELRRLADSVDWAEPFAALAGSAEAQFQQWTRAFVESEGPASRARFEQLTAMIATARPKVAKLALRFVAEQVPDPRFAGVLDSVARMRRALLDSPSGLNSFCRALLRHADTGQLPLIRQLRPSAAKSLQEPLEAKRKRLEQLPSPPPSWQASSSPAARQPLTRSDESALWATVYEHPEDLSARAVLSDFLSERGDPKGPFIAAQLAGDRTPPAPELAASLLGPIAPALRLKTLHFERGFPVSGNVNGSLSPGKLAVALLHREWATFERLEHLGRLAPTLRSLRSAPGLERHGADEWIKEGWRLPISHVGLPFNAADRAARLPTRLEQLTLRHIYLSPALDLRALFAQLRPLSALKTLGFETAMLRVERPMLHFTSDVGDAWPIWVDEARELPALETITWKLREATLELGSERERFDTLRIVLGEGFTNELRPTLVKQVKKLSGVARRVRVSEGPNGDSLKLALKRARLQVLSD